MSGLTGGDVVGAAVAGISAERVDHAAHIAAFFSVGAGAAAEANVTIGRRRGFTHASRRNEVRAHNSQAGGDDKVRARGCGAEANERLGRCRGLLDMPLPSVEAESPGAHDAHDRKLTWRDFAICPTCGGAMQRVAIVPRSSVSPVRCDTS